MLSTFKEVRVNLFVCLYVVVWTGCCPNEQSCTLKCLKTYSCLTNKKLPHLGKANGISVVQVLGLLRQRSSWKRKESETRRGSWEGEKREEETKEGGCHE